MRYGRRPTEPFKRESAGKRLGERGKEPAEKKRVYRKGKGGRKGQGLSAKHPGEGKSHQVKEIGKKK